MLLLYLGLVIAVSGCQHRPEFTFAPVEGTVTKDGRPLADVQVVFIGDPDAGTQGPRASGITDQDGHYHLHGELLWRERGSAQDGAVVGKHRVCITDLQVKADTPEEKRRVPPRYGSFSETPLRVEVQSGPQVIGLDVKSTGVEVK
jgi:hypothetical protein